jgi:hypothetical protein
VASIPVASGSEVSAPAADPTVRQLRDEMNRFRGRMFQAIEAVGLPDKQETALKGVIRHTTYDIQSSLEATLRERSR